MNMKSNINIELFDMSSQPYKDNWGQSERPQITLSGEIFYESHRFPLSEIYYPILLRHDKLFQNKSKYNQKTRLVVVNH